MNTPQANTSKRMLVTLWFCMLVAIGVYVTLTYVIPGKPVVQTPQMTTFLGILQLVAAVTFLVGMVVERLLIARASSAANVIVTGIVSAAIGESISVFGLCWFFISHQRAWEFFIVSGLYFLRLFVRLPEFNAKIDGFTR